jgi:hypothetical protein
MDAAIQPRESCSVKTASSFGALSYFAHCESRILFVIIVVVCGYDQDSVLLKSFSVRNLT